MCSLPKSRDIQKNEGLCTTPAGGRPPSGLRGEEPSGLAAHRQGEPGWPSGNAAETHRRDPPMDSRSRSPCPGGSGGTARMESRAGERPRACPHRGDRAAAGPSAAKSSISGVMHRRRFFRSPGRRRGRPCSAAGAVIRGGREVRLRCPCCPGGRPGSFAGGSGVHSVGAVRDEVVL